MKNKNKNKKPDFQGYATKNDLVCADGLVIRANAFAGNDGSKVPLVFAHQHMDPSKILGHAILKNLKDGVYAYCYLNNSQAAKDTREALEHGDIESLSIFANNLETQGNNVLHGSIKEVSVVLSGANPGAFVESVLQHGEPMGEYDDECIIFTGEPLVISHADENGEDPNSKSDNPGEDKTVEEVLSTLTDEQKAAVGILLEDLEAELTEKDNNENEGGNNSMAHHNVFESGGENGQDTQIRYLAHSDMQEIWKAGKRCGSFKTAFYDYVENNNITLAHSLDTTGMETPTGTAPTYGIEGVNMLFPEPHMDSPVPEMIGRNVTWVTEIMDKVSYTPFKRVKTLFADITEDEARAKGYIKGKQKKEEVFSILKRSTESQTIYKKQKLDKDDVDDIEDWNILPWIKAEMEIMFEEEKARAILIGDGRLADSEDKIKEDKIRPIVSDVPLFNTKIEVNTTASEGLDADLLIDSIIRGMKKYKGSGSPTFFTTEDVVTEMLLLKNKNGDRIYKTEAELASTLRVSKIVTVEVMTGHKVGGKDLIGVIVNPVDYKVGGAKNKKDFFEDFDIDYNQMKYLLEQKMSGALVKPFSAVTFLAKGTSQSGSSSSGGTGENEGDSETDNQSLFSH